MFLILKFQIYVERSFSLDNCVDAVANGERAAHCIGIDAVVEWRKGRLLRWHQCSCRAVKGSLDICISIDTDVEWCRSASMSVLTQLSSDERVVVVDAE
ncbi:hypothetical protein B296_00041293 [Ensete ventricosum]|uniref:Uncharacterized protein n=1 Tax=Ensete ventricosum TaxID=4639 RepID=A0A426XN55_ENSVE|nr:hypothetical protein B296_00041293 [Ensete ventricosum]